MSSIKIESFEEIDDKLRLKRYTQLITKFKNTYGGHPEFICRAPGRVNIIGEHIDYCGYSVLPMAISQDISIAIRKNNSGMLKFANTSDCYKNGEVKTTDYNIDRSNLQWYHYFLCGYKGVVEEYKETIDSTSNPAIEVLVDGNVPKAAGMSSSSAFVCAAGLSTAVISNANLDRYKLAELCTRCERYIGTQGGGMDQSISFLAEHGKAKLIGFNPLTVDDVKLPDDGVFVIAHSRVQSRKAVTSYFNQRVAECKIGCQILAKTLEVDAKDVSNFFDLQKCLNASFEKMLSFCEEVLHKQTYTRKEVCTILAIDEQTLVEQFLSDKTKDAKEFKLYERAVHVYGEAHRVIKFKYVCDQHQADINSDNSEVLKRLGDLMNESHRSCSELYECSCEELDWLTKTCRESGALGSRMTGAGWGGCTVSLVTKSHVPTFLETIRKVAYSDADDVSQYLFATAPSDGAQIYKC